MTRVRQVVYSVAAVLCGALLMAQAPAEEADSHIAAARAAAGLDFRNTFINLCLSLDGRGAAGAPRGAPGPGRGTAGAPRGAVGSGRARGPPPARSTQDGPPFK